MRTKTIRVSQRELAIIRRARDELVRKGYEALPPELRPRVDERFGLGTAIGVGAKLLVRFLEGP